MIVGRVSVIIPAYNYGRYIEDCIRSVVAQSYTDWEIILVDDGSTDDTEVICQKLARELGGRFQFLRRNNQGVSEARNYAIEQSSGEFIMPLDADDMLEPTALEDFVTALKNDSSAGYAYCNLQNYGSLPGELRVWLQGPFFRQRITHENSAASASMWRKSLWEKGVRYRHLIFEDWDLWLQIVAQGYSGAYVPKVLFKYRMHISGRTSKNRYLYLPALLLEITHNPSLYNQEQVAWATSALLNSPKCWDKPTIVFVPRSGTESAKKFTIEMCRIAETFIAQGHFVVALGNYELGSVGIAGLLELGLGENPHLGAYIHKLGMIGARLIVLHEQDELFHRKVSSLKNVYAIASTSFSGQEVSGGDCSIRLLDEKIRFQWTSMYKRRAAEDISYSDLVSRLLELELDTYTWKKKSEDQYWIELKNLSDSKGAPKDFSEILTVIPWEPNINALVSQAKTPWIVCPLHPVIINPEFFSSWWQYQLQFGATAIYQAESLRLPPGPQTDQTFEALKAWAKENDLVECSCQIFKKDWFLSVGGYESRIQHSKCAAQELSQRAELHGIKTVWLSNDQLLRVWSLFKTATATLSEAQHVLSEIQQKPSLAAGAHTAAAVAFDSIFAPAADLERQIKAESISYADRITLLLAWAEYAIRNQQHESAREAFKDILALDPEHGDGLVGMARSELQTGHIPFGAHYLARALFHHPEHANALAIRDYLMGLDKQ